MGLPRGTLPRRNYRIIIVTMNSNRIKLKANRNLYQDQITFISILAKQLKVSDSEILRRIIDGYIEQKAAKKEASQGA